MLDYLTAAELDATDRWSILLGGPDVRDPLMIESMAPRSGSNPVTGDAIAPPGSAPLENSINGHEHDPSQPGNQDLQYACIFRLAAPRDCTEVGAEACDCFPEEVIADRPVCHDTANPEVGTTQYYAKAYPGTRHLQVLRDLGESAVVASICPKHVAGDPTDSNFGYNPALRALLDRFQELGFAGSE